MLVSGVGVFIGGGVLFCVCFCWVGEGAFRSDFPAFAFVCLDEGWMCGGVCGGFVSWGGIP